MGEMAGVQWKVNFDSPYTVSSQGRNLVTVRKRRPSFLFLNFSTDIFLDKFELKF